jgi:hypothetical protein
MIIYKNVLKFLLQVSHVVFFYAAYKAWKKKYYLFSCILLGMIVISIATHYLEELYNYNDETIVEWLEKAYALTTLIFAIVIFRKFFKFEIVCYFLIATVFFFVSRRMYVTRHNNYLVYHTVWHLGSGYALLKLIDNAKVKNEE